LSIDDSDVEFFGEKAPAKCALGGKAVESKVTMVGEDKNFIAV